MSKKTMNQGGVNESGNVIVSVVRTLTKQTETNMTKQQIEKAYNQYQPLLHKLSHQCASRCGRPEEEVYGQACYLFMQATEAFNATQDKVFRPYLQSTVHNGLIKWGGKYDLPPDPETIPEPATDIPNPCKALMVKEWLTGLSNECREIAIIILNGPGEVLDLGMGMIVPKTVKGALRRYLRAKGWTDYRLWKTLKTLKMEVRAL